MTLSTRLFLMKRSLLLLPLFVLALASLSLACDSGEAAPSPLEPGTFEATISGDVTIQLAGSAIATLDAFGGEPAFFLKLQTPQLDIVLLSKESLEPLTERSYSVGLNPDDPESFSGFLHIASEGKLATYLAQSGTITVNSTTDGFAEGTVVFEGSNISDTQSINVQGLFNALVP